MEELDKKEVINNKNEAINKINEYLDNCIEIDNKHAKKVNLLAFWIKDYTRYIQEEEIFDSSKLKEYSRGDIIKVNLGFKIGNEEGGLHYCVVLDKKNVKSHSTLTVIPLTSLKDNSKIHKTSVFLGNELYQNIMAKAKNIFNSIDQIKTISYQEKALKNEKLNRIVEQITDEERYALQDFKKKYSLIEKILEEVKQMKKGSIALVNQITTISKQRIYNPKKDFDILSDIKLSDEKMNLIDNKIKKLYLN